MSVRAYLVHEDVKIIDGKRYVHEENEYLWNNWHDFEIWDVLSPYMNDMTNEECIGVIEIVDEEFDCFKEAYKRQDRVKEVVNKHKDVFQKIDGALKENYYFKINLY